MSADPDRGALLAELERYGYSRALWIASPGQYWLRPGGLSVVPESQALAEITAETEQAE
jgi:hypothetical protein